MRKVAWRALACAILTAGIWAQPAIAGRTVIDGGANWTLSGYCSPKTDGSCTPYTFATPLSIGGTSYSQFYVNSNGTVSLGSIQSFLTPQVNGDTSTVQTQLSAYAPTPVFSARFVDGPGVEDFFGGGGYDGTYVADTSINSNGFTVSFYGCTNPLNCGQRSIDLVQNATFSQQSYDNFGLSKTIVDASTLSDPNATIQQRFDSGKANLLAGYSTSLRVYTITLIELLDGFQVNYSYNAAAQLVSGTYGFNLPNAQVQETGPLQNRSYLFDSRGSLIGAVPEPATWLTMLLGFAGIGIAVRRRRATPIPA